MKYGYLDNADAITFKKKLGSQEESSLVEGTKSLHRLSKYLPERQFNRVQVILSSLHYDFGIPTNRALNALTIQLYLDHTTKIDSETRKAVGIVAAEYDLLVRHLNHDEQVALSDDREKVLPRWISYTQNAGKTKVQ